jgi:2'-5' RNA ligase
MSLFINKEIEKPKELLGYPLKTEQHSFGCLMIRLPDEVSREIEKFSRSIINDSNKNSFITDPEKHYVEDDFHITLRYGLKENNVDLIKQLVEDKTFYAPTVFIGKITKFKSDDFDVIKFSIFSKDLEQMNKVVDSKFTCIKTFPYTPHSTLALVKPNSMEHLIGTSIPLFSNSFVCNKLVFSGTDKKEYGFPLATRNLTLKRSSGNKESLANQFIRNLI